MHDADDPERRAVEKSGFRTERLQRDRASDDAGIGLEVPTPRAGAEDDDAPVWCRSRPKAGRRSMTLDDVTLGLLQAHREPQAFGPGGS